jgi:hypothetical protein
MRPVDDNAGFLTVKPPKRKQKLTPSKQRAKAERKRRGIEPVSRDRQGVWLGKDRDGTTDTSMLPVRIRVEELTTELKDLYRAKRDDHRRGRR